MKTNKIEKLEVPDLIVGNVYTNREQVDIINKINEIISVLNSWIFEPTLTIPSQSQKQPEETEEQGGVCKYCGGSNITVGGEGTTHYYYCEDCKSPTDKVEKQEEWKERWRKLSFEIGSITKQQADEVENFISQLLSERTFNKEELEIIAYSVASNATSEDGESLWDKFYDEFTDKYGENNDKLKIGANELIPKLSKLLKEKNG